ncbi:hypothetical protein [Kineococcus glutinatus]|uniref:Ig-like domain-containing protein n=1 Tax=Kineococcus glutinatus TaxID=1070872 RepID=A0ABP9I009_9ACTN
MSGRRQVGAGVVVRVLPVALVLAVVGGLPARAAPVLPDVTVRVTILELEDLGDDLDSTSDADFYTVTRFDDGAGRVAEHRSRTWDGQEHVHPNTEWSFAANPARGSVHVRLGVFDDDDTFNGGDDRADVVPGGAEAVEVDVALRPCALTGTVTGGCSRQIVSADGDEIVFVVDVLLPTATPGLRVQCLHTPIWPVPGAVVTIRATALDGAGAPLAVADRVSTKREGVQVASVTGTATTTHQFTAVGEQFSYECEAEDAGGEQAATTTPRTVRVGPTADLAVPIVHTGPGDRRIDVVVLPDTDAYVGWADPDFLWDLPAALLGGYYGEEFTLANQGAFNLWIGRSVADIDWPPSPPGTPNPPPCTITPPEDWDRYGFAEVGWILHDDPHRDCARGALRLFGAFDGDPRISIHETGHVPFGLADEYCCDGGYFTGETPNVYAELADCQADAPAVGRAPTACRSLGATTDMQTWFTSDPDTGLPGVADDLMVDQGPLQALDRRRWTNLLTSCTTGGGGC